MYLLIKIFEYFHQVGNVLNYLVKTLEIYDNNFNISIREIP